MKNKIETNQAPAAIGPYSQAVTSQELVFVSGQLPIDPATGIMPEDVAAQTRQSILNLKSVLEAAGTSINNVCKTTVFLQSMDDFAKMNTIYTELFEGSIYPARSAVEVAKLPKGALVEIEAIACK